MRDSSVKMSAKLFETALPIKNLHAKSIRSNICRTAYFKKNFKSKNLLLLPLLKLSDRFCIEDK